MRDTITGRDLSNAVVGWSLEAHPDGSWIGTGTLDIGILRFPSVVDGLVYFTGKYPNVREVTFCINEKYERADTQEVLRTMTLEYMLRRVFKVTGEPGHPETEDDIGRGDNPHSDSL